jgi:hypothetical protein
MDPKNPDPDPQHCSTTPIFIQMSKISRIPIKKELIILPEALGRFFQSIIYCRKINGSIEPTTLPFMAVSPRADLIVINS